MKINRNNYEEYFISYIENELSDAECLAVEQFANNNEDLKNELKLFQQTKLVADEKIIFADKESLLQKNSTKIVAWQWNVKTWAVAAMLLLAMGLGWWMMKQSSVNSKQFSEKKGSEKLEAKEQLSVVSHQLSENKNDSSFQNSISVKKNVAQKIFAVTKKEMPETIDIADLPDSWKNRKLWNESHEITVVQKIKPEEIIAQPTKKMEQIDTTKVIVQNSISTQPIKKQEEKMIAQIPFKTNKNERQILKMLAWASSKVLGKEANDGNFDVSIGFAEISHRQTLQDN